MTDAAILIQNSNLNEAIKHWKRQVFIEIRSEYCGLHQ